MMINKIKWTNRFLMSKNTNNIKLYWNWCWRVTTCRLVSVSNSLDNPPLLTFINNIAIFLLLACLISNNNYSKFNSSIAIVITWWCKNNYPKISNWNIHFSTVLMGTLKLINFHSHYLRNICNNSIAKLILRLIFQRVNNV